MSSTEITVIQQIKQLESAASINGLLAPTGSGENSFVDTQDPKLQKIELDELLTLPSIPTSLPEMMITATPAQRRTLEEIPILDLSVFGDLADDCSIQSIDEASETSSRSLVFSKVGMCFEVTKENSIEAMEHKVFYSYDMPSSIRRQLMREHLQQAKKQHLQ